RYLPGLTWMLESSWVPPTLLVVMDPRLKFVPLRTRAALYVVDGLPFWKPSTTFRRERRASSETTAVPEVAKRYPGGTPPMTAGTSLNVHSGPPGALVTVEDPVEV